MRKSVLLAAATAALAQPASAHIEFGAPAALADSYHADVLRVGHGCDGSATTQIRVEIPAAVLSAKPQPKPGWTIRIERAPLAQPAAGESGAAVRDRVAAISWTGRLEPDQFDEFGLLLKLGDLPGPLYFPTTQRCESGSVSWSMIPQPGQSPHALKTPAPVLDVRPASEPEHHMH